MARTAQGNVASFFVLAEDDHRATAPQRLVEDRFMSSSMEPRLPPRFRTNSVAVWPERFELLPRAAVVPYSGGPMTAASRCCWSRFPEGDAMKERVAAGARLTLGL